MTFLPSSSTFSLTADDRSSEEGDTVHGVLAGFLETEKGENRKNDEIVMDLTNEQHDDVRRIEMNLGRA
jgi:hypothetical protein